MPTAQSSAGHVGSSRDTVAVSVISQFSQEGHSVP